MEPQNNIDLSWLWAVIGAACTAAVNWFFGRKKESKEIEKADAENKGTEIDNVDKAIAIWRKLAEDMTDQVEQLKTEVKNLSEEISKLRNENTYMKVQVDQLIQENQHLHSKLSK